MTLRDRVAKAAETYLHQRADFAAPINFADLADAVIEAGLSERDAGWQSIDSAPRDGTVVDVWLIGSLSDIEFYCSSPPQKVGRGKYCGRSAGWMWLVDKWRPFLSGLNMPTFIQPTHWRPLPSPPDPKDQQS